MGAIRAAALALALLAPASALAQGATGGAGLGGPGSVALISAPESLVVDRVEFAVIGSTGEPKRDAAILAEAARRLALRAGDRLTGPVLHVAEVRLSSIPGVSAATASLVPTGDPERARVTFSLRLDLVDEAGRPTGVFAGEGPGAFPVLWKDEDSLLRVQLNGGFGAFSDGNPWFGNPATFTTGNPLVQNPPLGARTGDRATWAEGYAEFGLAGVTRLGDTNFAVYGEATAIAPGSVGQDIFRDDARATFDVEKLYGGLLWGSDDRARTLNVSVGRQNFTLNDGFLVAQYGSQWNAGPRPGIYLAPRTTHDFSVIAKARYDAWTAQGFYLDPNEYEPLESDTRLIGANLRRSFDERHIADATLIYIPNSTTRYGVPGGVVGTREGLWTVGGHFRRKAPADSSGFWVEGELAHQWHEDFAMNAWAGYAQLGYISRDLPWTPSLSYRYSYFTGDDPATSTYERYDPLYSGGLSQWLQGITINKALSPSNRSTHRVRLNVAPKPALNLTLDWFLHFANELNNIGGNPALATLADDYLGQEFQFVTRWAISRRLYFVGVASIALPGDAIDAATGGNAEPWTSLQAQLYWNF